MTELDKILESFGRGVIGSERSLYISADEYKQEAITKLEALIDKRETAARIDEVNILHETTRQEFGYETPWSVEVRDKRLATLSDKHSSKEDI